MVKKFQINMSMSNKLFYTFVVIGIVALLGVVVNALIAGETPNPGHNIQSVGPPSGCADGEVLQFIGGVWDCVALPSAGADTYCSISGSTISCPGDTSLTDTNTQRPLGVAIYTVNNIYCTNLGGLTTSSTCEGEYNIPQPNTFVGYLVAS